MVPKKKQRLRSVSYTFSILKENTSLKSLTKMQNNNEMIDDIELMFNCSCECRRRKIYFLDTTEKSNYQNQ